MFNKEDLLSKGLSATFFPEKCDLSSEYVKNQPTMSKNGQSNVDLKADKTLPEKRFIDAYNANIKELKKRDVKY